MSTKTGCVYLIGAGCGEMDLITLRGMDRLCHCDAVVYDDLIDEKLLDAAPAKAQRIYMGKRLGKHSAKQDEISDTLVELALQGKRVARLKGGDPFVFGRGGEEAIALKNAGVPFEEIPGISSSIAIPALAGIPVTHRGMSRSFHVITGHTADEGEDLSQKMEHLAALNGTLVFLMGLGHLEQLAEALVKAGKPAETPAAVVSGGNAPCPAAVRGTLQNIAERTRKAGVLAPAVIVVGETAAMNLLSEVQKPLAGIRVGVTGTEAFTQKLSSELKKQGAYTAVVSQTKVVSLAWEGMLKHVLDGHRHWLVFTSANGVRLFFDALRRQTVDLRKLAPCRFAVIGNATGQELLNHGFKPDLCPEVYTSEALAEALCKTLRSGQEVVLLRAKNSAKILPQILIEKGIRVRQAALYDVKADAKTQQNSEAVLEHLDYLTFGSAGGVRQFFKEHRAIPQKTVCVCIGGVTAKELARYDARPCLIAPNAAISQMVQLICTYQCEKNVKINGNAAE